MKARTFPGQKKTSIWDAQAGGLMSCTALPMETQVIKGPFPLKETQEASDRLWSSGRWIHGACAPGTGRMEFQYAGYYGFADARNNKHSARTCTHI